MPTSYLRLGSKAEWSVVRGRNVLPKEAPINLLDFVEAWWLSVRAFLEPSGVVGRFERFPNDRSNPSCVLNLRRNELEADLVVWQSGEAELGVIDSAGSVNQRHFDDIYSPAILGEILSALIKSISPDRTIAKSRRLG
jgi:hypothetical protein